MVAAMSLISRDSSSSPAPSRTNTSPRSFDFLDVEAAGRHAGGVLLGQRAAFGAERPGRSR